jgi:hypothetical protein
MKQVAGTGILWSLLNIAVTVIVTATLCYTIGIDEGMRNIIKEKTLKIISKKPQES